jgi:RNA polymerase sigma-70 factor (ECF subfamily)
METHEELRPYLFAIAYRMLGSVAEAEDVVQEAFLRYHEAEVEADSPKAYLATITTRLAIDQLRSARARREVYPGEWLPEPLVDDEAVRHAETADSLSLAFLHLLEKLSPVERAVFLPARGLRLPLRGGCADRRQEPRQLPPDPRPCAQAHRRGRRRFEVSREEREEVARRFLAAWEQGDTESLVELLAPDATVYGDGGGKAPAVPMPLVGAERVAKALIGWGRQARERGFTHRAAVVNGDPGLVLSGPAGAVWVAAFRDRGRARRRGAVDPEPRQAGPRGCGLELGRLRGHRPDGDDVRGEKQDADHTDRPAEADTAGAAAQLSQADCAEDERDEDEQGAGVRRDVADPEPGRVEVVREVLLRLRPLSADPHQDVRGQNAHQQRQQAEARQADGVVRPSPGENRRQRHGEQRSDQQHRAEDVQEEREVHLVGADGSEHAHAPGFQIMSRRMTKSPTLLIAW